MKNKIRKCITLAFALSVMLVIRPGNAFAAEDITVTELSDEILEGTAADSDETAEETESETADAQAEEVDPAIIDATAEENAVEILEDVEIDPLLAAGGAIGRIEDAEYTTEYTTAEEFVTAFNACTGDVTVTLLDDIDLGSACLTMTAGQNITLDLNGHVLTTTYYQAINITGGDLKVTDSAGEGGKIIGTQRAIICKNNSDTASNIVIEGGNFEGTNYAIFANAGCNFTITGGVFTATTDAVNNSYAAVRIFCPGTFVISGGTFNGINAVKADYSVDIKDEGGYTTTYSADVSIKGGVFNGKVLHNRGILNIYDGNFATNVNDYCVYGYRTRTLQDGRYDIALYAEADSIAQIGDKTYQTLQEAVNAAENGDTIKLLENEKEQVTIPGDKNITIDLNGCTLSYSQSYSPDESSGTTIDNSGTLNLINSNENVAYVKADEVSGVTNTDLKNTGTAILGRNIYLTGFINVYNLGDLEYYADSLKSSFGLFMADNNATCVLKDGSLYGTYGAQINGGNFIIEDGAVTGVKIGVVLTNCNSFKMTGGTVLGNTGLAILGGTVDISEGDITGVGSYNNQVKPVKPSDLPVTGDAIYIDASMGTTLTGSHNIKVNIAGGTFTSYSAYALDARFAATTEHTAPEITISGGRYRSYNDKDSISTIFYVGNQEDGNIFDGTVSVSSGMFSHTFNRALLAEDCYIADNTDPETKEDYPYTVAAQAYAEVIFDVQDRCTAPDAQKVKVGNKVSVPTDTLTAENYTFTGEWYKDSTFSERWDFDTDTVSEDITLYGKWVVSETYIQEAKTSLQTEADNARTSVEALIYLDEETKEAYKKQIEDALSKAVEAIGTAALKTTEDVDAAKQAGFDKIQPIAPEALKAGTPAASDFEFSIPTDAKYDGTTHWTPVLVKKEDVDEITCLLGDGTEESIELLYSADKASWSKEAPTHAGTYYVKAVVLISKVTKATVEITDPDWTYTVAKRSVTLTSDSAVGKYSGTALTAGTVTVSGDGFAAGEGAEYNITGAQTEVGKSDNLFTYALDNNTKADDYNISCVYGTLTVEKNEDGKGSSSDEGNGGKGSSSDEDNDGKGSSSDEGNGGDGGSSNNGSSGNGNSTDNGSSGDATTDNVSASAPNTGDSSQCGLWLMVMVLSLTGIGIVAVYRK